MARIKIKDLPKDMKISKEEMRKITGGAYIEDRQYSDAQLTNIDTQDMTQTQQQTVQTLSNVTKALHDTALAVIRKIG